MKGFVTKKCRFKLKSLDLSLNPIKNYSNIFPGFKLKSSDLSLNWHFWLTKPFTFATKMVIFEADIR